MAKSWKAEVIADNSGTWTGNALRFSTKEEAAAYADDLYSRWTAVRQWRTVECDDEPRDKWEQGCLISLEPRIHDDMPGPNILPRP